MRARLDLAGVGLLTVAMAMFIAPLIFGRQYGWRPWTWASLLGGAVLLVVFARFERRLADRGGLPLLDLDVLRPRGVKSGLLACLLIMGSYTAFLFAFTLHVQTHLGFGPLAAGLAFVPYAGGFATLSLSWARLPERIRTALPVAGALLFAAVTAVVAALTATVFADGRAAWPMSPLLFAAGAAHAAGYSPLIAQVSVAVGPGRAAALSALNSTGPMLAAVTAVAALGSLYLATGVTVAFAVTAALLLCCAASAVLARRGLARPQTEASADAACPGGERGQGRRRR
jgi:predicted MFS family arabinose efflux permease